MMGGVRVGVLGTDGAALGGGDDVDDVLGGGDPPPTLGVHAPVAMSTGKIEYVSKNWDPDGAEVTYYDVSGTTIDQVAAALQRAGRKWGHGGGKIKLDIPADFPSSHSVTVSAKLTIDLPQWKQYEQARDPEKMAWNRMFRKLRDHEDGHVEIAVAAAGKLAEDLIGQTTAQALKMLDAAVRRMKSEQQKLDDATDHGAKPGVKYGDVILDLAGT
jgi:predicted secreted Zn-dependent protease